MMSWYERSCAMLLTLLSTLNLTNCTWSRHDSGSLVDVRQYVQNASFGFSSRWEILGPFQIGTREAAWGADPLELYGGFRNISFNPESTFLSSLPLDGVARWSTLEAEHVQSNAQSSRVDLVVSFPGVQWDFLRTVYGWAAVQFQGWARGHITVTGVAAQSFVLYTDSVLEFWVDNEHFFGGDFYGFRKAPPVLWLEPGRHRLDVRLVRDVRAFGGIGEPIMAITLQIDKASGYLELGSNGIQISDLVGNTLAASIASITVRNSGKEAFALRGIRTPNNSFNVLLLEKDAVVLPGQTRPVAFKVTGTGSNATEITVLLDYALVETNASLDSLMANQNLRRKNLYEPHKVTYLHPGGIVSYVMLRPPQQNVSCNTQKDLPVLFFMHGAGNEAESELVSRSFDPVTDICAWVLFPTGVTPWSADDWHNWGFADVEAAINTIETWKSAVSWQGPGVDLEKWFACGHSNGGQGTWYALTHRPDNVIAAAPVSGYLSIQTYVPYNQWRLTDPRLVSIIQASTNSYRHELLISNANGINIHQQHGSVDDNVPSYNSRSMHYLLQEVGGRSDYTELPGVNHYFDGIMTTPNLQVFYKQQLGVIAPKTEHLDKFTLTVANPGDTGSKQGFQILLLRDPGQLGRLDIELSGKDSSTSIFSHNVLRFSVTNRVTSRTMKIDGQSVRSGRDFGQKLYYILGSDGAWKTSIDAPDNLSERSIRQMGPLDAIMRTSDKFVVRYEDTSLGAIALQISRNLQQYYYADTIILRSFSEPNTIKRNSGNMFTVSIGSNLPPSSHVRFPIMVDSSGRLSILDSSGSERTFNSEKDLAAIFLRPRGHDALELVVWGSDIHYAGLAARLVPLQTGAGQPDFLILSRAAMWKGVGGVVAAGFFDHHWQVTQTAYFA
ncbi:hypothetical protein EJ05DRAFT_519810 [Pseudovirgaria hyperparasitica]|uniref:Peptidase S9 prolyl oligopeptidase catalytic domain-containing protein n=1 Tax=Pseudovirgaria hyperparasitica TaxID=470096 RepID=A0A6A6VY29_9PEZI|nr:uncharacterized protein EJ05DRAFT_519810 [Pseudovirgaria hyperparasitica]KAF2755095.1 hypothetical protein EJ05DRAFT_519810 [Pseudovirgaria hyperparasitica]